MPRERRGSWPGQGRRVSTSRRLILLLLVGSVGVVGCSRFAFVRPDTSRGGFDRITPEVEVSDAPGRGASLSRVRLAQQRLQTGEFAEAERLARQILKREPDSADAHTILALALDNLGRARDAGAHYRRAAELTPARGEALNNYGVWLCAQGQAVESLAWFERAAAAPGYPTPAAAAANAGACAMRAGQITRAERDLRHAIALDPANPVALGALAELSFQSGRLLEARAFSERRLAAAPADAASLQLASQIEQKLGDSDAARRYVERMQNEFPEARNSKTGEAERR